MRTCLFVPGDRPDMHRKALAAGAGAVIFDLEDSVAPEAKSAACEHVLATILGSKDSGPRRWVRLDPTRTDDVTVFAEAPVDAVMVAKADPEIVEEIDGRLSDQSGGRRGPEIVCLVETARALERLSEMAINERVRQFMIGEVDLTAELGISSSPDGRELLPIRSRVVVNSSAHGLRPPIGPVWTDLRNVHGLRQAATTQLRQGFRTGAAIHPSQIALLDEVFTPTADETARARHLIRRYHEAMAAGTGVIRDEDGSMIDKAVVRKAHDVISRAHYRDQNAVDR